MNGIFSTKLDSDRPRVTISPSKPNGCLEPCELRVSNGDRVPITVRISYLPNEYQITVQPLAEYREEFTRIPMDVFTPNRGESIVVAANFPATKVSFAIFEWMDYSDASTP